MAVTEQEPLFTSMWHCLLPTVTCQIICRTEANPRLRSTTLVMKLFSIPFNAKATQSAYLYFTSHLPRGGTEKYLRESLYVSPLSSVLLLLLYLSVLYLLATKVIRCVLKKLSMTRHARERCAEATFLGVSTAVCLFVCWRELKPSRNVHRKENSLVGIFTQNRLFDELRGLESTASRAAFALVSAHLLHSAGVVWCAHGLSLQVVKKTVFFAFYVTAHNLRFKCLGPAATMLVTITEVLLQFTRVVCCLQRGRTCVPFLTYLSFCIYTLVWVPLFICIFPAFFLKTCLYRPAPEAKMPSMSLLCGSLGLFYVIEVATMPLLMVVYQSLCPAHLHVKGGRLERVLIPPSAQMLRELVVLRKLKQQTKDAQDAFDRRHGSCKKTRDAYKSLKMVMAVKRRIRNFRQSKLPNLNEASTSSSASTSGIPPSGDLHFSSSLLSTATDTSSDVDVEVLFPPLKSLPSKLVRAKSELFGKDESSATLKSIDVTDSSSEDDEALRTALRLLKSPHSKSDSKLVGADDPVVKSTVLKEESSSEDSSSNK